MLRRFALLPVAAVALAGCVHATPVTPAPLAPARLTQLKCDLLGTWRHATINGKPFREMRITWTFHADGTGVYTQTSASPLPLPGGRRSFHWTLKGRNIVLTHHGDGHRTVYRADHFGVGRMKWFNYATSDDYGVVRVGTPPGSCG